MSGILGSRATVLPSFDELLKLDSLMREQFERGPFDRVPSAFDPRQHYDYLSLLRSGSGLSRDPYDGRLHASSQFKTPSHPNRFVPQDGGLLDSLRERVVEPGDMSDEQTNAMLANIRRAARGMY